MSSSIGKAYLAALFTTLVWGISFLSIKVSVAVVPPMTLALLRFMLASVLLTIIWRITERTVKVHKKDIPRLALAGLTGVTIYFVLENNGVKLLPASTASLIASTIPILNLAAGIIFLKQKIKPSALIGVALSVTGVYLVVGGTDFTGGGSPFGYFMMLGAAVSWVGYNFLTRPLTEKYSQLTIVTVQTLFATASLIPLSFLEFGQWKAFNTTVAANIVFLGVFCSALGYYFYVYSLQYLGSGICALFINFIPAVTVATGFIFLGEKISAGQVLGGCLIVGAVTLVSLDSVRPKIRT